MTAATEDVKRAAGWLMLGVLGGLGLDLCGKEILRTYSLVQFILVRSAIAIFILLAIAPRFGGYETLRTRRVGWHLLRTIFAIGAMYGFFYGLANMPLVNALTLGYTAPLIVTALSALFLGENVGVHRWTAVIIGFAGVLIMLRPGSGEFSPAALAVLAAAVFYACQAITARYLGATESTLSLSFYVVVGPFVSAVVLIDVGDWTPPDVTGWVLMSGAAVCSIVAWIGFVNGYRAASPATLAPLEYVALVAGAIAGFLLWGEVPDQWVVLGAAIIVASGIYVVRRAR
jgi:drug/metabolite transporter (DMT)-like permease